MRRRFQSNVSAYSAAASISGRRAQVLDAAAASGVRYGSIQVRERRPRPDRAAVLIRIGVGQQQGRRLPDDPRADSAEFAVWRSRSFIGTAGTGPVGARGDPVVGRTCSSGEPLPSQFSRFDPRRAAGSDTDVLAGLPFAAAPGTSRPRPVPVGRWTRRTARTR